MTAPNDMMVYTMIWETVREREREIVLFFFDVLITCTTRIALVTLCTFKYI